MRRWWDDDETMMRRCDDDETMMRWWWDDETMRWWWDDYETMMRRWWDDDDTMMTRRWWDDDETMTRRWPDEDERMMRQWWDDDEILEGNSKWNWVAFTRSRILSRKFQMKLSRILHVTRFASLRSPVSQAHQASHWLSPFPHLCVRQGQDEETVITDAGADVVVTEHPLTLHVSITFWDIIRWRDLVIIRFHKIKDSWREFKMKLSRIHKIKHSF
jgi:hypothetical protein